MTNGHYAIAALLLGSIAPGLAQAQDKAADLKALAASLPGTLIDDPTSLDWSVYGPDHTHKPIRGTDIPGGQAALQVAVTKAGNPYDVSANVPLTAAVKAGEQIVIGFYARTVSAETADGSGIVTVRFQQNAAPYSGFGDTKLTIGKTWQFYQAPARATVDLPKGIGVAVYQLSGAKQVVQIGQTIVVSGASSMLPKNESVAIAPPPIMPPQLQGKGALLNDPARRIWASYGMAAPPEPIKVGIPGGAATRFTVAAVGANAWDAGSGIPIDGAIAEGDTVLVSFIARTISAATPDGKALLGVMVQNNTPPYPSFGNHMISVGPNWGLVQIRTRATMALPQGKGQVMLHLAGAKQVLEVGPVYVLKVAEPQP